MKGEGYCFGFHNELNPQGPNNGVFTEALIISRIQTKNYQKLNFDPKSKVKTQNWNLFAETFVNAYKFQNPSIFAKLVATGTLQ